MALGMTLAARAALLLREHVQADAQAGLPGCATFQQALAEQNSGAWEQATRLHTDGRPLQRSDEPLQRLVARATTDTSAAHALLAWQQLMHTEDQALEALSP